MPVQVCLHGCRTKRLTMFKPGDTPIYVYLSVAIVYKRGMEIGMKKLFGRLTVLVMLCAGMLLFLETTAMAGSSYYHEGVVKNSDGIKWAVNTNLGTLTFTKTGTGTALPSRVKSGADESGSWKDYQLIDHNPENPGYWKIIIGDGITSIGDNLFENETHVKEVTFNDSITGIGSCAFKGCQSLVTISFEKGCSTDSNAIGYEAFTGTNQSGIVFCKEMELRQLVDLKNLLLKAGLNKHTNRILINRVANPNEWRIDNAVAYRAVTKIETDYDNTGIILKKDAELEIIPKITPENASFKKVALSENLGDNKLEVIEKEGKYFIKGIVAGTTTLIIAATDDSGVEDRIPVTITEETPVLVTDVQLSSDEIYIPIGETKQLVATVIPENASQKKLSWKSADTDKVTVSNGYITGKAVTDKNPVLVVASTIDGTSIERTCKVYVIETAATAISLDKKSLALKIGESADISATVFPQIKAGAYIEWSSDNTKVATVDAKGHVVAVSEGTAKITACTKDGNACKATCEVVVSKDGEIPGNDPNAIDPVKRFTDVPAERWYSKSNGPIAYVVANNIMSGMGDGSKFGPEEPCTRAQFVQILYNTEGKPDPGNINPFTDVPEKWYTAAIKWAYANGVTSGKSETIFAPDESVTRETIAQFLFNYAKKKGYDTSLRRDLSGYSDKVIRRAHNFRVRRYGDQVW